MRKDFSKDVFLICTHSLCFHPAFRLAFINLSDPKSYYIENEADLNEWCSEARAHLIDSSNHMLFEITEIPPSWPCCEPESATGGLDASNINTAGSSSGRAAHSASDDPNANRRYDTSDDEFELL